MKILKKRVFATIVDSFIFGFIVAPILLLFPNLSIKKPLLILLLIPFFCRDLIFGNASIGKMLFGIAVYDKNWQKPGFKRLIMRSFGTATVGYALVWKSKFIDGNMISVFDWERNKFGTRVVDKKVFKELERAAKEQTGQFEKNMSDLYDEYLRNMYIK